MPEELTPQQEEELRIQMEKIGIRFPKRRDLVRIAAVYERLLREAFHFIRKADVEAVQMGHAHLHTDELLYRIATEVPGLLEECQPLPTSVLHN